MPATISSGTIARVEIYHANGRLIEEEKQEMRLSFLVMVINFLGQIMMSLIVFYFQSNFWLGIACLCPLLPPSVQLQTFCISSSLFFCCLHLWLERRSI